MYTSQCMHVCVCRCFLVILLVFLDVFSHWFQMYASLAMGATTHKASIGGEGYTTLVRHAQLGTYACGAGTRLPDYVQRTFGSIRMHAWLIHHPLNRMHICGELVYRLPGTSTCCQKPNSAAGTTPVPKCLPTSTKRLLQ